MCICTCTCTCSCVGMYTCRCLVDVLLDVLEYVLALVSGASGASAGPAAAISNLHAFRTCRPCNHIQPAASVLEYVHVVIVCSHSEAAGPSLAACLSEPSLEGACIWSLWSLCWNCSSHFEHAGISNMQVFPTCRPCSHFQPAASVLEYIHVVTVCSHFEAAGPGCLPIRALSACQHGWSLWSRCWICRRVGICWICRWVGTLGRWR